MGMLFGVLSILLWLLFIPVLILTYKKKIGFLYGVGIGAGLFLLSFLLSAYAAGAETGESVINLAVNESFGQLEQNIRSFAGASFSGDEAQRTIDGALQALDELKKAYLALFPAMLILSSLAFSYALFMLVKLVRGLFRRDVSGALRFCDLRMSRSGVVVGAAAYLAGALATGEMLSNVFSNIAVVLLSVLTVCGLSVIDYKCRGKLRSSLGRFAVYLAVFAVCGALLPLVCTALLFVGAADAFFNLRLRVREEK